MSDEINVIEEENVDFEELLQKSFEEKDTNSILNLTMVDIQEKENKAFLDLSEKLEGFLNLEEITDENGALKYKVGDNIDVIIVDRRGGRAILSHKKVLEKKQIMSFLENEEPDFEGKTIEVTIKQKTSKGYIVNYKDDIVFFLPFKLAFLKPNTDTIGKKIKVKVVKVLKEKGSVIVSRIAYVVDYKKNRKIEITELLEKGEESGTVKVVLGYGIFIQFNLIEAFVSYKEISHKGPVNPLSYYKVGDTIKVALKSYNKDKNYIEGSIKDTKKDPWGSIDSIIKVGDIIDAKILNVENFGLFIDIKNDLEAFVHISEYSNDRSITDNFKENISKGETLKVKIISINYEKKQIKASVKALLPDPIINFIKNYSKGDVVNGKVVNFIDFGAFVNIDSVDCFIHNRNYSWGGEKISESISKGDNIEAKISEINLEKNRVYLNRLPMLENPFDEFVKSIKVGDKLEDVVVKNIKNFGIFVSIGNGVDGLIKKENLSSDNISIGDKLSATISYISLNDSKIQLTTKEFISKDREYNKSDLDNFNNHVEESSISNFGMALKDKFKN